MSVEKVYRYSSVLGRQHLEPLIGIGASGNDQDPIGAIIHSGLGLVGLRDIFSALAAMQNRQSNILAVTAGRGEPITEAIVNTILEGNGNFEQINPDAPQNEHTANILPHVNAIASLCHNPNHLQTVLGQNLDDNTLADLQTETKGVFITISNEYNQIAERLLNPQPNIDQAMQQQAALFQQFTQQQLQMDQLQQQNVNLGRHVDELEARNTEALRHIQHQQNALNGQNVQLRNRVQELGQNPQPPVQPGQPQPQNAYVREHSAAIKGDIKGFLRHIASNVPHGTDAERAVRDEVLREIFSQLQGYKPSENPSFVLDLSKIGDKLDVSHCEGVENAVNNLGQYLLGNDQNVGSARNNATNKASVDKFALEQLQALAMQQEGMLKFEKEKQLKKRAEELADNIADPAKRAADAGARVEKFEAKLADKSLKDDLGKAAGAGGVTGFGVGVAIAVLSGGFGWPAVFICPVIGAAVGAGANALVNYAQQRYYKGVIEKNREVAEKSNRVVEKEKVEIANVKTLAADLSPITQEQIKQEGARFVEVVGHQNAHPDARAHHAVNEPVPAPRKAAEQIGSAVHGAVNQVGSAARNLAGRVTGRNPNNYHSLT